MFGQPEHRVSDADTTSVRTRPLTPASDNSLNSGDGLFGSKKRKRDGSTMDDLLKDKFVIKVWDEKLANIDDSNDKIAIPLSEPRKAADLTTSDASPEIPSAVVIPRYCSFCEGLRAIKAL